MPALGVVGTMVWDRIHARDVRQTPVEEWGGIAYALSAAAAACPPGWSIVPIVKIGRDLEEEAFRFLRRLPGLDLVTGVRVVPEPNNRVELRYQDRERRCEQMSGGVPPWTFAELEPILPRLDALYINFISGFEFGLDVAQRVRAVFKGPIYADLHSLFLGIDAAGWRTLQPLAAWRNWLRCFDIVQVNEDELGMLSQAWGDPWRFAAEAVNRELRLLIVTLGPRGMAYVAAPEYGAGPAHWQREDALSAVVLPAAARSAKFPPPSGEIEGDPTGCGDVWGATCFCALLAGQTLDGAASAATEAATRNVRYHGATGLFDYLRGRIPT
jgi:sugar/nucleoside kinase (ribokinase family)